MIVAAADTVIVTVPMMQIRIVRMPMHERCVPMTVSVGLCHDNSSSMTVLVVRVMDVPMVVLQLVMRVIVFVPLGEMQP